MAKFIDTSKRAVVALVCSIACFLVSESASAQVAVVSSTVDERVSAPGERYTGSILLRNTSAEPQEVKLYAADYSFHANGKTAYAAAGTTPRSNARWITLQTTSLVLPAHGDGAVTYTVVVPEGSDLTGTYWCMLMVETLPQGSLESSLQSTRPERTEVGLRSAVRYGIQVATHFPEAGSRTIDLAHATVVEQTGGTRSLQFDVVNTGERAYRPVLVTELYGESGQLAARLESTRGLVYPGSSVQQSFALPTLRRGSYKVLIIADTGAEQLFAAQYRMKF